MADDVVLSYYDSLLRRSDVELLQEGQWLNDNIIAFMMEYFEQNEFKDSRIGFVSPSVSQLVKLCDDCSCFLDPLSLDTKQLIFLVINDNNSRTASGGSHWSLLVYRRSDNCFSHFDSYHSSNISPANDLVKRIKHFVNASKPATFQEGECPQQTNGCDCGVYVVSIIRHLCQQFFGLTSQSLLSTVTASTVGDMRRHITTLIKDLSSEQQ